MSRISQLGLSFLLLLLICGGRVSAQDQVARQFDPGVIVDIDAGKYRYDIYVGREKSEELEAGDTLVGAGASFRAKPIFKSFLDSLDTDKQHVLVISLGYEFRSGGENEMSSKTHTAMADGTLRYAFPKKILMSDRNRFELRWVDGDPGFRYRNRLRFERPFRMLKRQITPYGGAEAYWDSHFHSWNKFRYSAGVEVPVIRRTHLDLFYTRERCVTCPDPHTDILGINLKVFLRLKK